MRPMSALLVLCLLALTCGTALGAEQFPNGYKELRFGDKPPKAFVLADTVFDATSAKSQRNPWKVYASPAGSDPDFFGFPTSETKYEFCQNKLNRVCLTFTTKDMENIAATISQKTGTKPIIDKRDDTLTKDSYMSYRWSSKHWAVHLTFALKAKVLTGEIVSLDIGDACEPD